MTRASPSLRRRARLALLAAAGVTYAKPRGGFAPQSVLLIRPDHLGDTLLLTPALSALRRALPDAHLVLLVGPWSAPALAGNPDIDAVETLAFPGFERMPRGDRLAPYRLLSETARKLHGRFDTAVVLRYDHWWGAWLAAAARIPRRVGYAWPETLPFLTEATRYEPGRHEALQNARLLEALAPQIEEGLGPTRYHVNEADRRWAADRLAEWEAGAGASAARSPRIAIHPGAGAAVKQWPVASWAAVASALQRATGAGVVLTGGETERELTSGIARRIDGRTLDLAGQTSFGQLAAVYSACDLVLGSDSGPLHLAVATGAKTLHLYGPVPVAKFGPWGDPARNLIIQTQFSCAPCDRLDWPASALPLHGCIAAIRPAEVTDAAMRLLRRDI